MRRSLVIGDSEQRRLELAPLVAQFLRRKSPSVVEDAGQTLVESALRLILEHGHQQFERYHHLEAKWPVAEAALPLFLAGTELALAESM